MKCWIYHHIIFLHFLIFTFKFYLYTSDLLIEIKLFYNTNNHVRTISSTLMYYPLWNTVLEYFLKVWRVPSSDFLWLLRDSSLLVDGSLDTDSFLFQYVDLYLQQTYSSEVNGLFSSDTDSHFYTKLSIRSLKFKDYNSDWCGSADWLGHRFHS